MIDTAHERVALSILLVVPFPIMLTTMYFMMDSNQDTLGDVESHGTLQYTYRRQHV